MLNYNGTKLIYSVIIYKTKRGTDMKLDVLIVDDTYDICEEVQNIIEHFQIPEIGIIKTCYTTERALGLCQTFRPQIVLMDIKMSEGRLIQELRKLLYPVKFLVFSGYDDYTSARGAFQNGTVEYLLRPILPVQLEKVLHDQCRLLLQNFSFLSDSRTKVIAFSKKILTSIIKTDDPFALSDWYEDLQSCLPGETFLFSIIAFSKENPGLSREIIHMIYDFGEQYYSGRFLCALYSENKIGLLLNVSAVSYELYSLFALIRNFARNQVAISLSSLGRGPRLYPLYYEAENRLCLRLTEGFGKIFDYDLPPLQHTRLEKIKSVTFCLFRNPELFVSDSLLEQLFCQLHTLNISGLKRYYHFFISMYRIHVSTDTISGDPECFHPFYDFCDYSDFENFLRQQIESYRRQFSSRFKLRANIEAVKAYIDSNYTRNISLNQIADLHHISYSYLSRLFHKKYHVTFHEYLTGRRMAHAKQLLHSSELSVQEIATMSGYENAFHFSRAFKNYFGISPNHYRKQS